jgi:hypothetical protein
MSDSFLFLEQFHMVRKQEVNGLDSLRKSFEAIMADSIGVKNTLVLWSKVNNKSIYLSNLTYLIYPVFYVPNLKFLFILVYYGIMTYTVY